VPKKKACTQGLIQVWRNPEGKAKGQKLGDSREKAAKRIKRSGGGPWDRVALTTPGLNERQKEEKKPHSTCLEKKTFQKAGALHTGKGGEVT